MLPGWLVQSWRIEEPWDRVQDHPSSCREGSHGYFAQWKICRRWSLFAGSRPCDVLFVSIRINSKVLPSTPWLSASLFQSKLPGYAQSLWTWWDCIFQLGLSRSHHIGVSQSLYIFFFNTIEGLQHFLSHVMARVFLEWRGNCTSWWCCPTPCPQYWSYICHPGPHISPFTNSSESMYSLLLFVNTFSEGNKI